MSLRGMGLLDGVDKWRLGSVISRNEINKPWRTGDALSSEALPMKESDRLIPERPLQEKTYKIISEKILEDNQIMYCLN